MPEITEAQVRELLELSEKAIRPPCGDIEYICVTRTKLNVLCQSWLEQAAELERLLSKYEGPAPKCGHGHVNNLPLALWDCPMCTEEMRKELELYKKAIFILIEQITCKTCPLNPNVCEYNGELCADLLSKWSLAQAQEAAHGQ